MGANQSKSKRVKEELKRQVNLLSKQLQDAENNARTQENIMKDELKRCTQKIQILKEENRKLGTSFYEMQRIERLSDDDLSTIMAKVRSIEYDISQCCSRFVLTLKSGLPRSVFTDDYFPELKQFINSRYLDEHGQFSEETPLIYREQPNIYGHHSKTESFIDVEKLVRPDQLKIFKRLVTKCVEKLITHRTMIYVLEQPLQLGVSLNESFGELVAWMKETAYDSKDSINLRNRLLSHALKQDKFEKENVEVEKQAVVFKLLDSLRYLFPFIDANPGYEAGQHKLKVCLSTILKKALELDLAVKEQKRELEIKYFAVGEDFDCEDDRIMSEDGVISGKIILQIRPLCVLTGGDEPDIVCPAKVLVYSS